MGSSILFIMKMQVKATLLRLLKLERMTLLRVNKHMKPLELPLFAGEIETGTITWKTTWKFIIKLKYTLWMVAHQAPLSKGFFKQEYCSWLPFSPSGDLPNPGIQPTTYPVSPA